MYLLILFIPLITGIILGIFGRCIGYKGASIISSINIIITFLLSLFIFYEVGFNYCPTYIYLSPFINTFNLNIN